MNKELAEELEHALLHVRNAAVPLPDDLVRRMIAELHALAGRIVEWGQKNNPRW
jgi:chromosome condensin MukBEF complex kleisin-like MukF subunit